METLESTDRFHVYSNAANDLFSGRISERDLLSISPQLPLINVELLNQLAQYAEKVSLVQPRHGWAITQVAFSATNLQQGEFFTKALAAWYLGRAANHWGRPKRVTAAISSARRIFLKLNHPGWIAACDWQQNVLSWTRPNFIQAVSTLGGATSGLRNAGFTEYEPHCRLALAYTQILVGNFIDAAKNIWKSESEFADRKDILNQARCRLNYASLLRRQSQFDQALDELANLLKIFEEENSPLDVAKTYSQMALTQLLRTDNLPQAISQLERAANIFAEKDLDLWEAACLTNLGALYIQGGQFVKAKDCLKRSKKSFVQHGVLGQLADTLNDIGKLNVLVGLPNNSISQYKRAEEIHRRLGAELSAAIDIANCGEAYGYLGRYQEALHSLEWAIDLLKGLNNPLRSGTCEKYLALLWARLGQPSLAHEHLDNAEKHYEKAGQRALIASIYNSRAQIYFEQGDSIVAIEFLRKSLAIAEAHNLRPQAALTRRLLGEALLNEKNYDHAYNYLQQAITDCSEMGMIMDRAACMVALGIYYTTLSDFKKSKEAFEIALSYADVFPEIEWRAFAGLARLAESQGNAQAEIQYYRQAMNALQKVRLHLWQPSLVGSYIQNPSIIIDKAILLAAQTGSHQDALQFIETNKSVSLLLQLSMFSPHTQQKRTSELNDIKAEIDWIQSQLRLSFDSTNSLKSISQSKQLRSELAKKIKQYDMALSRHERRHNDSSRPFAFPKRFDIEYFRKLAINKLGESWIALDYYVSADQLFIVVLTPDFCRVIQSNISQRFVIVLETMLHNPKNIKDDLRLLGDVLIPTSVAKTLSPNTHLLIAPHKKLHGIPWAALQPASTLQPLVFSCIPSIVPSLHSLIVLFERALARKRIDRTTGLLVGLSKFSAPMAELPYVQEEIATIKSKMGVAGQVLSEADANWDNLLKIKSANIHGIGLEGLSCFSWMHIASHIFTDRRTGRLSGIVLHDRDIWLEQLLDLAPLPSMVTFSGCHSIYSYIFDGDEHVGLPAACFIGGADSVVGSLWPVIDSSTARFMMSFYDYYFDHSHPARSIAEVQREMINQGEKVENWASFICMGVP